MRRGQLLLVALAGAIAALVGGPAGAQTAADDPFWAKTHLDENALGMFDAAYPCLKNELDALFCLREVDAIGNLLSPPERLVPKDIGRVRPERIYDVLKDYGPVMLVRLAANQPAPPKLGWDEARARRQDEQQMYIDASKSIFAASDKATATVPDFLALREDFLSRLPAAVSRQRAIASGLNAGVLVFDAHAHMDPTEQWDGLQKNGDQQFVGIGASIGPSEDGRFVIQDTVEGGSARAAGVKTGDIVTAIDSATVIGLKIDDVVSKIRGGPKGSTVHLDIERRGQPIGLEVTRDTVKLLNVAGHVVNDLGPNYGYLKLSSFLPEKTCDDTKAILQGFEADKSLAGMTVVDLRGNLGGDLNQGLCVAGLLFGHKEVVMLARIGAGLEQHLFTTSDQLTDRPLAVLINETSASASEFLAGAVQDYKRGWLVGTTTLGKGSAQTSDYLDKTDRTVYYFSTEARFYLPSGRTNQRVGVQPDFTVYSSLKPTEEELHPLREEDLIFSALSAEGQAWVQPRQAEVAKVQACVDQGKRADQAFGNGIERQTAPDLQLFHAEEVLACSGPDAK